jgi:hypothetical protein
VRRMTTAIELSDTGFTFSESRCGQTPSHTGLREV